MSRFSREPRYANDFAFCMVDSIEINLRACGHRRQDWFSLVHPWIKRAMNAQLASSVEFIEDMRAMAEDVCRDSGTPMEKRGELLARIDTMYKLARELETRQHEIFDIKELEKYKGCS